LEGGACSSVFSFEWKSGWKLLGQLMGVSYDEGEWADVTEEKIIFLQSKFFRCLPFKRYWFTVDDFWMVLMLVVYMLLGRVLVSKEPVLLSSYSVQYTFEIKCINLKRRHNPRQSFKIYNLFYTLVMKLLYFSINWHILHI